MANQDSRSGLNFPSQTNERAGRFVGFSETVGHPMTYKVLTEDTNTVIFRSRIKSFSMGANARIHPDPHATQAQPDDVQGEDAIENPDSGVELEEDTEDNLQNTEHPVRSRDRPMASIDPDEIIGRSYLSDPGEDGTRSRLHIVERINQHDQEHAT